jgi:hypothetical protein
MKEGPEVKLNHELQAAGAGTAANEKAMDKHAFEQCLMHS